MSLNKTFQIRWNSNDFVNLYRDVVEYISDDQDLDGYEDYNDKIAETIFLEHLLEISPELCRQVQSTLTSLPKNQGIRFTLFTSLQEAISKNPLIYKREKNTIKNIINNNLDTEVGLESLIQIIIQFFDFYTNGERNSIIESLQNNIIIKSTRSNSIANIGFSLLRALSLYILQRYDEFRSEIVKIVMSLDTNTIKYDITGTISHLYCFLFIFSKLRLFFKEFDGFDKIFEDLDKKMPKELFWKFEEMNFWEKYSEYTTILIKNIFNLLFDPVYLSPDKNLDVIDDVLKKLVKEFTKFVQFYFCDNLWKYHPEHEKIIETFYEIPKKSVECFNDISNYGNLLKSLFNLDFKFDESMYFELEEYYNKFKENLDNVFFLPVRLILRKLFTLMEEKEKTYQTIRIILNSIMDNRKKIIPILGPFSDKEPDSPINNYFERIAIWLSNLSEPFTPIFIPGKFQGIKNSMLFDLFIQMSRFIICLYLPSKSAGHVDEISRLLEHRFTPPVILLSKCDFPTTTQVEGIASNSKFKIFCFNEGICPNISRCAFNRECKKKKFPKPTLEKALEFAIKWAKDL